MTDPPAVTDEPPTEEENIMPKTNKKTANTDKRRTKVKELSTARNLDAAETKKVRGGVIAIIAPSARMGDGSVKPISPTLLPYIEKK